LFLEEKIKAIEKIRLIMRPASAASGETLSRPCMGNFHVTLQGGGPAFPEI